MRTLAVDGPLGISKGDTIGYHPLGKEDVRQVGIVKGWDGVTFVVSFSDDPGIEERVRPEDIQAHSKGGSDDD